jgi:drug/metabolite transporter (DMT)-like permease
MLLKRASSQWLGIIAGALGAALFSTMALFVRLSQGSYTPGQLMFVRGVSSILILSWICRHELRSLFSSMARFVWLRAVFGGISVGCYYWNLQQVSLGTATVLADLSPVFVLLFELLISGIKPRFQNVAGLGLALTGIVILSSPLGSDMRPMPLVIGILGAMSGALAYLSLKQATTKFSTSAVVLTFSISLIIVACFDAHEVLSVPQTFALGPLVGVIFSSLFAQVLMTISYKALSATTASAIGLSAVVWAIVFDGVFLKVAPTMFSVAAMVVVLVGIRLTQSQKVMLSSKS